MDPPSRWLKHLHNSWGMNWERIPVKASYAIQFEYSKWEELGNCEEWIENIIDRLFCAQLNWNNQLRGGVELHSEFSQLHRSPIAIGYSSLWVSFGIRLSIFPPIHAHYNAAQIWRGEFRQLLTFVVAYEITNYDGSHLWSTLDSLDSIYCPVELSMKARARNLSVPRKVDLQFLSKSFDAFCPSLQEESAKRFLFFSSFTLFMGRTQVIQNNSKHNIKKMWICIVEVAPLKIQHRERHYNSPFAKQIS
jgi:hypothetical protein